MIKRLIILVLILFQYSILYPSPIGMIKVNDSTYVDESEIDVGSWLSYYSWTLDHEGYVSAQKVMPDSNAIDKALWKFINTKTESLNNQFAHSTGLPIGFFKTDCSDSKTYGKRLRSGNGNCSLVELPITGISYEQVIKFCEWRTNILGENKIVYKLPTPEEWKHIALIGLSELNKRNGYCDTLYKGKCPSFNYKIKCQCDKDSVLGKLNGIAGWSPDKNGLYDLFGNVSEMTSLKNVAKGGNFNLYAKQCHFDSVQYYEKPMIWLGFRCIATIGKVNKNTISQNPVLKPSIKDSSSKVLMNGKFGSFIDNRDGTNYRVVLIGSQLWMAENLKFKPDSGEFWYPENNFENAYRYGYSYNWQTAKNVCPSNWHLPTKEEFDTLMVNIGGNETQTAYNELLPSGSSGFSLLFAGSHIGINYVAGGLGGIIWSSTESKKRTAWCLGVGSLNKIAGIRSTFSKSDGFSVRCIKDK
jgi:uncharacterized protein (TIGR02145 family)